MPRAGRPRPVADTASHGSSSSLKSSASRRLRSEGPSGNRYVAPGLPLDGPTTRGAASRRTSHDHQVPPSSPAPCGTSSPTAPIPRAGERSSAVATTAATTATTASTKAAGAGAPGLDSAARGGHDTASACASPTSAEDPLVPMMASASWSPGPRPPVLTSTTTVMSASAGEESGRALFTGRRAWAAGVRPFVAVRNKRAMGGATAVAPAPVLPASASGSATVVPLSATESEPHARAGPSNKQKPSSSLQKGRTGTTPTAASTSTGPSANTATAKPARSTTPTARSPTAGSVQGGGNSLGVPGTESGTSSPQPVPHLPAVVSAAESAGAPSVPGTPALSRHGSHAALATLPPARLSGSGLARAGGTVKSAGSHRPDRDEADTLPPLVGAPLGSVGGGGVLLPPVQSRAGVGSAGTAAAATAGYSPGASVLTRSTGTLSVASGRDVPECAAGTPVLASLALQRSPVQPQPVMAASTGASVSVTRFTTEGVASHALRYSAESAGGEAEGDVSGGGGGGGGGAGHGSQDTVRVDRERLASHSPPPSSAGVPRQLRNFGATCYMNATLQCLLHTTLLIEGLEEDTRRLLASPSAPASLCTTTPPPPASLTPPLTPSSGALMVGRPSYAGRAAKDRRISYLAVTAPATSSLVELARGGVGKGCNSGSTPSPAGQLLLSIKGSAAVYNDEFSGNGQNDAHEFLRTILYVIHDEVNRGEGRGARYEELRDVDQETEEDAMLRWTRRLRAIDDSTVYDTFGGVLRSRCECRTCGHVSLTFDPFLDLSLPVAGGVPGGSAPGSTAAPEAVNFILRESYMEDTEESLSGGNQLLCDKCKKLRDGVRRSKVLRWPRILVLHLKRFDDRGHKNRARVIYPERFTLEQERYRLYGVCCHSGSESFGHYTSYVCVPVPLGADAGAEEASGRTRTPTSAPVNPAGSEDTGANGSGGPAGGGSYARRSRGQILRWYLCNDNHITEVDAREAVSALENAYILFYCQQSSAKEGVAT